MIKRTREWLTYTMIFWLGYVVACGGGKLGSPSINIPNVPVAATLRMLSSSLHRPAIFPSNTGNQPVIASAFGAQSFPEAAIANPSQLAQSYESLCDSYGTGLSISSSIHAGLGNSGLVPLNFRGGNICQPVLSSVGADEGGNPNGFPVILSGTINTLVAYGTLVSGNHFRCLDTTNVAALTDGAFVRAYYDLAHDAVVLGSGTTQLPVTCSITIPAGDDVQHLEVQWLKS